jgi:hypothetical protein
MRTMSMNIKLIGAALALVLVVGGGFWAYTTYQDNQMVVAIVNETIVRPELGISFTYPSGEAAFALIESPATADRTLLGAFVMVPTGEYLEFQQSTEAREAPPAMSVFVFADTSADAEASSTPVTTTGTSTTDRPDRMTRLKNWAAENTALTSYALATTPAEEIEIDGLKTLHYRADGLYQQDIYLASYRSRIYIFVGQFNDEADITYTAFQTLMSTVVFE